MELFSPFVGSLFGVLIFGCFVQVITILSILRYGLGLNSIDMGIVTFVLAVIFSLLLVETKFSLPNTLEKTVAGEKIEFSQVLEDKIKPFLIESSDPFITQRVLSFNNSSKGNVASESNAGQPSLLQIEASFLLSQLKRALSIGLILLIPLIVIDIMVAVVVSTVGIQSLSAQVLSIPLKLLLFTMIDGWSLIVNKLLVGFI